jgi:hypothetical protein
MAEIANDAADRLRHWDEFDASMRQHGDEGKKDGT